MPIGSQVHAGATLRSAIADRTRCLEGIAEISNAH
jgi:hypothetical protein